MRFAVHRPGNPVASPRSHGVPRRDVPGRIHVRVAGETAGCATEDGLTLARLRITCPHAGHRWLVNAGLIFSTRPGALFAAGVPADPTPNPGSPGSARPSAGRSGPGSPRAPRQPGHVPNLQVFDPDRVEPLRDARGHVLRPVLTPVTPPGPQHRFLGGRGTAGTGTYNTLSNTADISGEVTRRASPA